MVNANENDIFHCRICKQGFMTEGARERHEQRIHVQMEHHVLEDDGNHPIYNCQYCGKKYSTQEAVEVHEKDHVEYKIKQVKGR